MRDCSQCCEAAEVSSNIQELPRRSYEPEEDETILRFIRKLPDPNKPQIRHWKALSEKMGTARTWESLKNRWKVIGKRLYESPEESHPKLPASAEPLLTPVPKRKTSANGTASSSGENGHQVPRAKILRLAHCDRASSSWENGQGNIREQLSRVAANCDHASSSGENGNRDTRANLCRAEAASSSRDTGHVEPQANQRGVEKPSSVASTALRSIRSVMRSLPAVQAPVPLLTDAMEKDLMENDLSAWLMREVAGVASNIPGEEEWES